MKRQFLLLLCFSHVGWANEDIGPDLTLVRLHGGVNAIDLNADGREDAVVVANRENFNAHGFEMTTVYL